MHNTIVVGNVRLTVEPLKHRHACRCAYCGRVSVEERAYRFLKRLAKREPRHPHTNAHDIARNLGVSYRTALAACMNHPKITMEAWHVKSSRYTCREFSAE